MKMFLISLAAFGIAILGMAIGVIISNKRLKGSCGGLNTIMGEDCMFCERKETCEIKNKAKALAQENESISKESSHLYLVK